MKEKITFELVKTKIDSFLLKENVNFKDNGLYQKFYIDKIEARLDSYLTYPEYSVFILNEYIRFVNGEGERIYNYLKNLYNAGK